MADPRLARSLWRGRTNVDALTIAWIEHAEDIVRERWPKIAHLFVVTQGGYQGAGGDPDSADTHALGGGTDFSWCGHPECLLALRLAGGFVWWRKPEQGDWPDHMHGAPIGHPFMAPVLARQETSYFARRNGLKNNGPDDGPQLDPIPRPIWPYPEDDMFSDDDRKLLRETNTAAEQLLKKAENSAERERTTNALLRKIKRQGSVAADDLAQITSLLDED